MILTVQKRIEKLFLGLLLISIVGIVLVINYYPHYYALKKTPKNYVFSGQASWFDPWDITNYFAVIRVAQKDRTMLVGNINTTDVVKPTLIYPLYTLAGKTFPKANPILVYHLLAVIFGCGLAITIFLLANLLLKNFLHSLYVLVLASLGGGFGFADITIPGVTFLSTFQKPHEALAAILYLTSLVFFFRAIQDKKISSLGVSIFCFALLIPIYPYRVLSFMLITGISCLFFTTKTRKKYPLEYLAMLMAVAAPIILLYVDHFLSSGFAVLTSYQPPPVSLVSLLLGYGVFGIVFAGQVFFPIKNNLLVVFLNLWIGVSLILSILPFGMSRLFLSGVLFPLTIITILMLRQLDRRFKISALLALFLLIPLYSSFYVFSKRLGEVKNNNIWFYLPKTIMAGVEFLKTREEDGVLALPPLTSYVPAMAGKHVYFGLKDQTPDYSNRVNQATLFYQGNFSPEEAKAFLEHNRIHFIIATDAPYSFLIEVFRNQDIKIYYHWDFSK